MIRGAILVQSLLKIQALAAAGLALVVILGSPPQPASAQSADPLAWAPPAIANAQRMRNFPDAAITTQLSPIIIPKFEVDLDPSGLIATDQPGGPTFPPLNAFFQNLGTNGRTCFTCHQPQTGWTVSAASVQLRFNVSLGTDPIFRLVDGATCPSDNVSSFAAKGVAYQLLTGNGLIRIGLPLPPAAQFTITNVADPYNCSNNPAIGTAGIYSFYRRPLLTTNLVFQTANPANQFMWDGREPSLTHQSIDATLIHAQASNPPTAAQQGQMVSFESGLFTAQNFDNQALILNGFIALNATGGPVVLSQQAFLAATPTPPPPATPTVIPVFDLYTPWASLTGTDPVSQARESVARGQALFNAERPKGACGGCHNTVDVGNNDNVVAGVPIMKFFNTGVASAGTVAPTIASAFLTPPNLPVFTVTCIAGPQAGNVFTVSDLGVGMITGLCADIGKFKSPTLRGLASRAPFFHNGSATTLAEVVAFYVDHFGLTSPPTPPPGTTPVPMSSTDQQDLVNFLNTL
jgi:cytochrome c peroxidase